MVKRCRPIRKDTLGLYFNQFINRQVSKPEVQYMALPSYGQGYVALGKPSRRRRNPVQSGTDETQLDADFVPA